MSRRSKRAAAGWAGIFAALFLLNLHRDLKVAAAGYRWEKAAVKDLFTSVNSVGVVEAVKVQPILSEVSEKVEKVKVKEGDVVREGQELMRLTNARTRIEYEQSLNNANSAEARYENAVKELAVQKKLLKNFAVSRSQVEAAERAVEESLAARNIAKSELDLVWKRLQSTRPRAPIAGLVLRMDAVEGANVSPGTRLALIGDVSRFIVRTKVDELDIRNVSIGQPAQITVDAYPDLVIKGVVSTIASQAEREAFARIEVLIDITEAPPSLLKHNLSVKVRILTGEITGRVGIPAAAVLDKTGASAVVIVRNVLGLVRERRVELGRTAGDDVEVIKGIAVGETVGVPVPKAAM